jgi:hypothetical protein
MKRIIMKLWIIALTSVIIGLVLSLAVAALLQDHVSRPVSVGLTFWVQMVWMIPFFLSFSERKRGNNSSGTTGMVLLWLLTITGLAGAVAAYKYFVWSG